MITRLSETWKQQKKRKNYLATCSTKDNPTTESRVSTSQNKSIKDNDINFLDMSSVDWNKNESIFSNFRTPAKGTIPSIQNKEYTKVSTPLQSSTKQPNKCVIKEMVTSATVVNKPLSNVTTPDVLNESLSLSNWNLPATILNAYERKGIVSMFPWQQECLLTGSTLDGGNLVYSAPTSAGKTLVAEILMLKRVIETKRKAIYILPFVSVAREKMSNLRDQFEEGGVKVGGFMGSESPPGGFSTVDIAVCTIEKANSLINRLMEERKLSVLCSIIVDEMHMLGDPGRGYLLELLLTKVTFVSTVKSEETSEDKSSSAKDNLIQVIGLSATLPNLKMLADWLNSDLYFTDFRPVPLLEMIKSGSNLFDSENKKIREIPDLGAIKGDEDKIIPLCVETIQDGNSVLIFCPTKIWCEKLAATIAQFFARQPDILKKVSHRFQKASKLLTTAATSDAIEDVLDQLQRSSVGLDDTLKSLIQNGVAFHHAGLTFDERDIIEGAFRRGVLRILVATSTLSSGVNLPARRVIIRSPMFHGKLLDSLVYKQMAGRAGRKGVDTDGESILVCKPNEKTKSLSLLSSHLKPVYSCLLDSVDSKNLKSMKRALLEVIAAGVATTPGDVERYSKCTFLHACLSELKNYNAEEAIMSTMRFLLDNEFIRVQNIKNKESPDIIEEKYFATQLGSATLASALSPDEALLVFHELRTARKCFVLENELHIIYQITPIYFQDQWPDLDWFTYFNIWERLPTQYKNVGELVGVKESLLARAVRSKLPTRTEEQLKNVRILKRFYAALVLQDLVNEVPLPSVSKRYKINRGLLQSLQNSAATFAGMVTVFCQKLGWNCLELLLDQFQNRLSFGVNRELCNLVRISLLNGFKARVLYDGGYQTVSALAYANKDDIAKLLRDSSPFESKENINPHKTNSRFIWLTGKEGLTDHEAAELIITEAKRLLSADANALGIPIEQIVKNTSTKKRRSLTKSSSSKRKATKSRITHNTKITGRKRASAEGVIGSVQKKKSPLNCKTVSNENQKEKLASHIPPLDKVVRDTRQPVEYPLILCPQPSLLLDENKDTSKNEKVTHRLESKISPVAVRRDSIELFSEEEKSFELFSGSSSFVNSSEQVNAGQVNEERLPQSPLEIRPGKSINPLPVESPVDEASGDSMLFLPGSLRLSGSEERQDGFVSPLKLEEHFNEATTSEKATSIKESDDFIGISITDSLMLPSQIATCKEMVVRKQTNVTELNQTTKKQSTELNQTTKQQSAELNQSRFDTTNGTVSCIKSSLTELSDDFLIIDVASQEELFVTFLQEWKSQKTYSFSLACESVVKNSPNVIGRRMKRKSGVVQKTNKQTFYSNTDLCVVGFAVCWGHKDAYYINLEISPQVSTEILDDTMLPPAVDRKLTIETRVNALKSVLSVEHKDLSIISFDLKDQMKLLFEMFFFLLPSSAIRDPKVANWMLDPDEKPRNLHSMVKKYLTEDLVTIAEATGGGFGTRGLGLVPQSPGTGRIRACVEAVLSFHLMGVLEERLKDEGLMEPFLQIEMPSISCLAVLELNGIGFSDIECERLKDAMKSKLESIEQECYQLANHTFSITSTDDVAKVLFHELCLPPNGVIDAPVPPIQKRSKGRAKSSLSTSKAVLEKLVKYHRLPKLILEWRRVNSALTKVVYPVQRKRSILNALDMSRIYSEAQYHTSTGRVTFSEPNLQNVPKEFDIKLPVVIADSPPCGVNKVNKKKKGRNQSLLATSARQSRADVARKFDTSIVSPGEVFSVSMRSTFIPYEVGVFVAADYSQLELRLIAHLSSDQKLINILNSSTADVFKSIAAEVHRITVDRVTPTQRQSAKQICYGIIYGIGGKALSEQLGVSEEDACVYMQQFKDRYSGVKHYIKDTIDQARTLGYVKTMSGRRRYLKALNSSNAHARSQAERQAVNTTVQGSAADLVKKAMCAIDCELTKRFRCSCLRKDKPARDQRGAYLVLQLHDELIYEVNKKDVKVVQGIIKHHMENAYSLSVKFPVKLKMGNSWGALKDVS